MSEFFDDLARTLAKPMPRSRALRTVGAALVTAVAPAALARPVSAAPLATQACTGCGVPHLAGCVLNKTCGSGQSVGFPVCCKWPGFLGQWSPGGAAGLCAQAGAQENSPPGGLACCCPPNTICGNVQGGEPPCVPKCNGPVCSVDKQCCPKKTGRCVKGKCCPAIRTTKATGPNSRAVACCPAGTIAVPGATGLCCRRGHKDCCDKFDPRNGDDDLSPLPPPRGKLCVNGKLRKA